MRVLIVDDSLVKISSIVDTIREQDKNIRVDSAINVVDALLCLSTTHYDLLILDIMFPFRMGEEPKANNARSLLETVYRKEIYFYPAYVLGLTQFDSCIEPISKLWNVIKYDPTSLAWKHTLSEVVRVLIRRSRYPETTMPKIRPTIYLEGLTDVSYLSEAIRIFNPELLKMVDIMSAPSAGANWVSRKIVIWANSLHQNDQNKYYKALGVFDGDRAGKDALTKLNNMFVDSSAMKDTYKTYYLSLSDACHLIPLKQKGIIPPITIESLFPFKYWRYASANNLLEPISDIDSLIHEPKKWDKMNYSFASFIEELGLNTDEKLYLNKINFTDKEKFSRYILSFNDSEKKEIFKNFDKLLSKIESII